MRLSVDSNILVYLVDGRSPARQASALEIVRMLSVADSRVTLQALAEFRLVSIRKRMVTADEARTRHARLLELFGAPLAASLASLERAARAWEAGRFSFWDAMLLAAAGAGGCHAVISEDMHDGAELDGVRVIGAFDDRGGVSEAARSALGIA